MHANTAWEFVRYTFKVLNEMIRVAITTIRDNANQIFLYPKSGISMDEPLQRRVTLGRHANCFGKVSFQPFIVNT